MSADTLFTLFNLSIMPAWLLLIVAPGWRGTRMIAQTMVVPAIMAVIYLALLVWAAPDAQGGLDSIASIQQAFSNEHILLMGWVHYLCFDLFVGTWIAFDARRLKLHPAMVAPCLVLTLMLGPAGLLAYLLLRIALRRAWFMTEQAGGRAE